MTARSLRPLLPKAAFVKHYAAQSHMQVSRVGKTFFEASGYRFTATRCRCGDESCQGWAMDPGTALGDR